MWDEHIDTGSKVKDGSFVTVDDLKGEFDGEEVSVYTPPVESKRSTDLKGEKSEEVGEMIHSVALDNRKAVLSE